MFPMGIEVCIPQDDMVRFFAEQCECLDYTDLYVAYCGSSYCCGPGHPPTDPKLLFMICAFAYANDIYSSRKIEEACRKRIDFMWLLDGTAAPDHTTIAHFRSGQCKNAIEELFYQYVCLLEKSGATDHEVAMIDGTKIESYANRYTFVWRGTVEKNLEKLKTKAKDTLERLKIQKEATIEAIRSALRDKQLQMAELQIEPVYGRGHRKTELQRDCEELSDIYTRWQRYEDQLKIMGPDRNSYSKTDTDATFMRMKDDHMRNGQLKPAYNVQICVNSEFIVGIGVFSERNDINTLEPFLDTLINKHGQFYKNISADAGYESLANYRLLESLGIKSFIKPTNYEQLKTKNSKTR
jgi:transposase